MLRHKKTNFSKCKGIIVWDFDGVLFDIKKFREENYALFRKYGVPTPTIKSMRDQIRKKRILFSVAAALRIIEKAGIIIPLKKFRQEFYRTLSSQNYLYKDVDRILHKLKRLGFCHFILSFGSTVPQYKKMHLGCGKGFARHFEKIMVTSGHKHPFLNKLVRRNHGTRLFFIDDTKEHIELVNRHVPSVKTIFYTRNKSLKDVRRIVLATTKK